MSDSDGTAPSGTWTPLFADRFDQEESDDPQQEDPSPSGNVRHGRIARDHSGLCRRGHAGHRR